MLSVTQCFSGPTARNIVLCVGSVMLGTTDYAVHVYAPFCQSESA